MFRKCWVPGTRPTSATCGRDVLYKNRPKDRRTPADTPTSTPSPSVRTIVADTAAKSTLEYVHVLRRIEKSTRLRTATMMVAASVAFGRKNNNGVSSNAANAIPTAVNAPAAGVSAPASKFTTDREKPPVTGYPPERAAAIFDVPRPTSS